MINEDLQKLEDRLLANFRMYKRELNSIANQRVIDLPERYKALIEDMALYVLGKLKEKDL